MAFVGRRGQILLAVLIVTWCLLGLVFAAIPEKAAHAQAEQEAIGTLLTGGKVDSDAGSYENATEPLDAPSGQARSDEDTADVEVFDDEVEGRKLQCSGYWSSYSSCSGGQKCRKYTSTYVAPKPYVAPYVAPVYIPYIAPISYSWSYTPRSYSRYTPYSYNRYSSWNFRYSRRSLQGADYSALRGQEAEATGRNLLCMKTGESQCTSSGCPAPRNCAGYWTSYGGCSGGSKCRHYVHTTSAANGGAGCPYGNWHADCTTSGCPAARACQGYWGGWGGCSGGQKCRYYRHSVSATNGGTPCPYSNWHGDCTTSGCPKAVACQGYWTGYGGCHKSGSSNQRCKTYRYTVHPQNGGAGCGASNGQSSCTTSGCSQPVDCLGQWGSYGGCHKSGSSNQRCRKYTYTRNAAHNGAGCPYSNGANSCTTSGCSQPVNCVGNWGSYGSCHYVSSGHKNQRCRKYTYSTHAAHNGAGCPYSNNYKQCTTSGCSQPVDCAGSWGSYGSCYHQSSNHKNYRCRYYKYSKSAAHNGYGCPYSNNYKQCTTSGCSQPVDCAGSWTSYGSCKYVSSGHKNERCRTYKYSKYAAHNGYTCPFSNNYVSCTKSGCSQPVDCAGSWAAYGACTHTASDHKNRRCRYYKYSTNAAHNGFACPFEDNLKQCTKDACSQPVDCVGDWKEQGGCWFDQIAEENVKCRRYEVSVPSAYNGTQCDFTHNELKCSSQGCGAPKDCVGEWSDYGECKLDAGVGLNTRCRLYNIVSAAENNGKECGYTQDFQSCTTSGCEQATPPSPEGSNSTTNGTLVDGEGSEENENGDGQNTDDGKSKDGQEENSESAEDGSALGESEEDKETSTASAGGMALIGGAVAGAVCCLMGLGFVYHRQKRKRDAAYTPSADYQAVSQGSKPANASSRQSMLLMNPMFGLTGKSRKSTIAMKSGARMSFLSNPLFDKEDEDEDVMPSIAESPQGSDGEGSELLGGETGRAPSASAYSNPLYSTTKGNAGNAAASEQSIEESMELLGKEFEASISQLSESVVETTTGRDLEFALHTWQELSSCLVESKDEVVSVEASAQGGSSEQMTSDKLHILKQSLNKIEQGTLLNSSMSTNEKSDFCKLINQARSKLRSVEKLHSYRRSRGSTAGPATAEWQKARMKLKAIAKFRQDKK